MSQEPSRAPDAPGSRMQAIRQLAIREFRSFLTLFLYLWVLFGLFVFNQAVIEREHGGTIAFQGFALVNALVLAKVMLVSEELELARWLKGKPLAVVILYEASFCTLLFLAFHVIERLVVDIFRNRSVSAVDLSFGGGGALGAVIVAVILFVSLLPFFAFKNVARAIGPEQMRQILFQRPSGAS